MDTIMSFLFGYIASAMVLAALFYLGWTGCSLLVAWAGFWAVALAWYYISFDGNLRN